MKEIRNRYKILVGKSEGKRATGIYKHRSENNIKMGLRKIWLKGVQWIHLAQDRNRWWAFVITVMILWFLSQARNVFDYLCSRSWLVV
jgi:hypothetical protein